MQVPSLILAFALVWLAMPMARADSTPHHELDVRIDPQGHIRASDRITFDGTKVRDLLVRLAPTLKFEDMQGQVAVERLGTEQGGSRVVYRLYSEQPFSELRVRYFGQIETERNDGLSWDGGDGWYPDTGADLLRFRLRVEKPDSWDVISQGEREDADGAVLWTENHPQDTIYLIAGPFVRSVRNGPSARAEAYLRSNDPALAARYLDVTEYYLSAYARLIGPYPYAKFAVVENNAETGYGMPSFTLLGQRVIRLPFILHSSYPHEILHNWWGNGVYVDFRGGNWSEGLTAYLADHWIQEQSGKGAAYRRDALKRYADYVSAGEDFPIRRFVSRHNDATQAVGYSKTLMVFHMLRRLLGDELFIDGLRRFYQQYRFRFASFDDLRRAFEHVSGRDLKAYFSQWIERSGAPDPVLVGVSVRRQGDEYVLEGELVQRQGGTPYQLALPLAITLDGESLAEMRIVQSDRRRTAFRFSLRQRPIRVDMDPRFDLFRRLAADELPVTLGRLFGASEAVAVLPSQADASFRDAYLRLAKGWQRRYPGLRLIDDRSVDQLPTEVPVWVLGKENRFAADVMEKLVQQDTNLAGSSMLVGEVSLTLADVSLAAATADRDAAALGIVQGLSPAAVDALARKLPHYGKYSLLLFEGDSARNVFKREWTIEDSAAIHQLGSSRHAMAELPEEHALGGSEVRSVSQ